MFKANRYSGRRVLVVEDDYFIVQELTSWLEQHGAVVIGPAPTVDRAVAYVEGDDDIDAAILDINLNGELAFAVADLLMSGGVPFVFATGYDENEIPIRYNTVPRFFKPVEGGEMQEALFGR